MENYFSQEIKRLKQELTNLKPSAQTSAESVATVSQTLDFNIPLALDNPYLATGTVYIKITSNTNSVFMVTLDSYYDDISNYRQCRNAYIEQFYVGDNTWLIYLNVEGDQNDINTLSGGGSVSVPRKLTIRAMGEFETETM